MARPARPAHLCECGEHAFVKLTRYGVALVSPQDLPLIAEQPWVQTHQGYAENRFGKLHRHILNAPAGLLVDHENLDKLDCRRANLRLATDAQSVRNRRKLRRTKSPASPFIGVHRNGSGWIARIVVNGRRVSAGTYPTQEQAAAAYDAAAVRHVGEFARLNFRR
jgi:hypothetical protein